MNDNDPHLVKDKKAIEDVQKFALKVITSKWDSSAIMNELLELVGLQPLEERLLENKLGLLFKIVHNLYFYHSTDNVSFQASPRLHTSSSQASAQICNHLKCTGLQTMNQTTYQFPS